MGFMIAYYPDKVFETMGALEQPLFCSTVALIETFESICQHSYRSILCSYAA